MATVLALCLIVTGAVVAWGMYLRARHQVIASLRDRAERAETELQLRVEQARQAERTRTAREMHDVLGHRIALLSMQAGALEFAPDAGPGEIARTAGVIRENAHLALQDLREVIGVLRDGSDEGDTRPQPRLADVPTLVDEARAAGLRVRADLRIHLTGVPAGTSRSAYRIVQEGLTNACKHAAGAPVDLVLDGAPGVGLTVELRNPPALAATQATRPDDPARFPGTGVGLIGLTERAVLVGGRLEHGFTDGGGFRLSAWLPWQA